MWRFFYHYFKQRKQMSVHFRDACYAVDHIVCKVPCETKWNKRQPYLVMRGMAHNVAIDKRTNTAYIT